MAFPAAIQKNRDRLESMERGRPWRTPGAKVDPVLVDFTAKSCLTCKLNLASSLEIGRTRGELKQMGAVAFKADYTDEDPAIGRELRRYNTYKSARA